MQETCLYVFVITDSFPSSYRTRYCSKLNVQVTEEHTRASLGPTTSSLPTTLCKQRWLEFRNVKKKKEKKKKQSMKINMDKINIWMFGTLSTQLNYSWKSFKSLLEVFWIMNRFFQIFHGCFIKMCTLLER